MCVCALVPALLLVIPFSFDGTSLYKDLGVGPDARLTGHLDEQVVSAKVFQVLGATFYDHTDGTARDEYRGPSVVTTRKGTQLHKYRAFSLALDCNKSATPIHL